MKESRRETLKYLPESVTREEVLELIGVNKKPVVHIVRKVCRMGALVLVDLFALAGMLIFVPWPLAIMLAVAFLLWGVAKWY